MLIPVTPFARLDAATLAPGEPKFFPVASSLHTAGAMHQRASALDAVIAWRVTSATQCTCSMTCLATTLRKEVTSAGPSAMQFQQKLWRTLVIIGPRSPADMKTRRPGACSPRTLKPGTDWERKHRQPGSATRCLLMPHCALSGFCCMP